MNQRCRCSNGPCVKLSGTTSRPDRRCSVSSPIAAAVRSAALISDCSPLHAQATNRWK